MAPEQKADIVCAFHGDLDIRLERIENKINKLQDSINEMLLWRAGVKGAAGIIALIVSFISTIIVVVVKDALFKR